MRHDKHYMNTKMNRLLGQMSIDLNTVVDLHPKLDLILKKGLFKDNEAILFQAVVNEPAKKRDFRFTTEREAFENHIHIDPWYLEVNKEDSFYVTQALAFVDQLLDILLAEYTDSRFRVILGIEWSNPSNCTVRFHKRRDNEPVLVEKNEIERFGEHAILVFDT